MRCPRCEALLELREWAGIVLGRCPTCRGVWIDQSELENLAAQVLTDLKVGGSLPAELRAARERRWSTMLSQALE